MVRGTAPSKERTPTCANCGAVAAYAARFCTHCGSAMLAPRSPRRGGKWLIPVGALAATAIIVVVAILAFGGGSDQAAAPAFDEAAVRQETRELLDRMVLALTNGDREAFLSGLDSSLQAQVSANLDISGPRAAELASALQAAKPLDVYPGFAYFEVSAGDRTYLIYVLKEGGEWKLGGL